MSAGCGDSLRVPGHYGAPGGNLRYSRAAWFSTFSRVKRPLEEDWTAWTRAVADGRQEFGHMYLRMKSCALRIISL